MKVIVAGAGIVGLTTAIALRAKGAEVVVLEKAGEVRAAGAAIGLWPNAVDVFEEIGVGDSVRGLGVPVDTWFFSPAGDRLRATGHGDEDHRFILVPRSALNARLALAVGSRRIKLDARLASFTETAEGVEVQLESGETLQADVLIGADGVYSEVRRQLLPGHEARHHHGHHAWRGLLPSGIEPADSTVLTVGRRPHARRLRAHCRWPGDVDGEPVRQRGAVDGQESGSDDARQATPGPGWGYRVGTPD